MRILKSAEDKKIYGYLKSLGVSHIYSVSFGADITTWAYISYLKETGKTGLISQPCPAIVNYIEKYQPDAELVQEVKKEMDAAYSSDSLEAFNDKFGATVALKALGRRGDYQKEVGNMIFQWKEEYRRICRI